MVDQSETQAFWRTFPHDDLALRCAVLHQQRRELQESLLPRDVETARRTLSNLFISGQGVEVGAGSRPFPLPDGAQCFYGDIRDGGALAKYFATEKVNNDRMLDAQTFAGIENDTFDFVISAHVIEHLEDPIGAIGNTMRILRQGGIFMLVVPDKRHTFDHLRPVTPIAHLLADFRDGGKSTRQEAYEEFLRHVSIPVYGNKIAEADIPTVAHRLNEARMDLHFHTWTTDSFLEMLRHIQSFVPFDLLGHSLTVNENAFVLRKV